MTNFRGRPFVFLSEAILTPPHGLATINTVALKFHGSVNQSLLGQAYKQAALSVKSQAQLFKPTAKFKPAQHREWLTGVAKTVCDTIDFPSQSERGKFLETLPGELAKVQNYSMPDSVRQFITNLEARSILWGVISNEGPLYQAVLKYVGASPFCTVQARPGVFKPLPIAFAKALQKVPRESRKNVWFVGSAEVPYDNVFIEGAKCVLLGSISDGPVGLAQNHCRISSLDELYPMLDQPQPKLEFSKLPDDFDIDDGSVKLTSFKPNERLPLGEKDKGLVDLK